LLERFIVRIVLLERLIVRIVLRFIVRLVVGIGLSNPQELRRKPDSAPRW
jgi:hypothetical protein